MWICPAGERLGNLVRCWCCSLQLTGCQSNKQVGKTGRWAVTGLGGGEPRLDQGGSVYQAFVWVQTGKEADVPVLVGLQSHHGLFQLVSASTARILEVRWTQNSVSGKNQKLWANDQSLCWRESNFDFKKQSNCNFSVTTPTHLNLRAQYSYQHKNIFNTLKGRSMLWPKAYDDNRGEKKKKKTPLILPKAQKSTSVPTSHAMLLVNFVKPNADSFTIMPCTFSWWSMKTFRWSVFFYGLPFSITLCRRALATRTRTFATGSDERLSRLGSRCWLNCSMGMQSSSTTAYGKYLARANQMQEVVSQNALSEGDAAT